MWAPSQLHGDSRHQHPAAPGARHARRDVNDAALLRHARGEESSQVGDDLLDVLLHMR
jgi:hypothetical protein